MVFGAPIYLCKDTKLHMVTLLVTFHKRADAMCNATGRTMHTAVRNSFMNFSNNWNQNMLFFCKHDVVTHIDAMLCFIPI